MCRWIAYQGAPIYLDDLLFKPENSLINQALHARNSRITVNGDGFGVGWYGDKGSPAVYRDVSPAWNDENLRNIAEQVRTRMLFAHVRASTGTAVARNNCHPFRHGRWLFMHNGQIGGFDRIARKLDFAIAPELYRAKRGTTDSESLFLLAVTFGLDADPAGGLRRAVALARREMTEAGIAEPFRMAAAATDGRRIVALRYSSDNQSPSLFHGHGNDLMRAGRLRMQADDEEESLLVVSEPLDGDGAHWSHVDEGCLLTVEQGRVRTEAFVVDEVRA